MTTLAEHIIVAGAENRPPMLEKSMFDSWVIRIRLFIKGKRHGRMMLDSIDNGPLVYPTIEENWWTRPKKYSELTEAQQLQDDCDVQASNIILHGLLPDILYNLFDKFAYVQGETLYEYYWRFSQLINDMHTIGMTMPQVQFNTKFPNALPSEWSKFVTDVKLAKIRITRKRYPDPLALVANSPALYNLSQSLQHSADFPQLDSGLAVPTFQQGEDLIECTNKAMAFLSVVASRFPPSNNQLRMSSNPRNQATIQYGRVTVQQVYRRQSQSFAGARNRGIATTSRGNYAAGQPRVVTCYNCQGEGHMARQCTQPKRPRNVAWFKEKLMLVEAQERTEDLDNYDSDCDDLSLAKVVLMANLSSCDPEVLSESQDIVIQDTNPSAPNDLLVLSLVEQMIDHVAHLDKENKTNKMRIQPTLYDGSVIAKEHDVIPMIDDEETLILEEESRSKMLDKQNDPISIEKKIKISLIVYSMLNKIKEDFGKRFVTRKELSVEQAFWLKHSSFSETLVTSHTPVRIEAPSELPKVSLVNESLKKLKYQLANFENVLKKRTTSDATTASAWALKNELRKLKGKNVVDTAISKPNATIAPGMFKLDIEPISHRLKNNRDAHEVYIEKTIENTDTLHGFIEHPRTQNPSEPLLESACMFTKHVQELLVYVSQTCPNSPKPSEKLVYVTPMNKDKRGRFSKPVTSSSNIPK
ncbi:retrovirus-related pol polyprotein from transposon TNT 1-94 [Tanacetum coccineum]